MAVQEAEGESLGNIVLPKICKEEREDSRMNILVACEESGRVCKAFREKGHNAFSCDLMPTSGELPQYHIIGDCLLLLEPRLVLHIDAENRTYYNREIPFITEDNKLHAVERWDMLIAFPPCTYLARSGSCNNKRHPERIAKGWEARDFFMALYNAPITQICIENPIPQAKFNLPPRTMRLQPYEYGHPYTKYTCLWLKNLPPLMPTVCPNPSYKYESWCKVISGERKDRAVQRSKTFEGVAQAMAEQWG